MKVPNPFTVRREGRKYGTVQLFTTQSLSVNSGDSFHFTKSVSVPLVVQERALGDPDPPGCLLPSVPSPRDESVLRYRPKEKVEGTPRLEEREARV